MVVKSWIYDNLSGWAPAEIVCQQERWSSGYIDRSENVLADLEARQEVYYAMREMISTLPDNLSFDLVLEYGIVENEATIKWLKKAIKRLEESL